jgi:outer membrane murein-binding lipoprotein Lpp
MFRQSQKPEQIQAAQMEAAKVDDRLHKLKLQVEKYQMKH